MVNVQGVIILSQLQWKLMTMFGVLLLLLLLLLLLPLLLLLLISVSNSCAFSKACYQLTHDNTNPTLQVNNLNSGSISIDQPNDTRSRTLIYLKVWVITTNTNANVSSP